MHPFFDRSIEFLKGVGPQRAETLNKELGIFTFGDLLQHYPFRHEDRSKFYKVKELQPDHRREVCRFWQGHYLQW